MNSGDNIENELRELSPVLFGISKKNIFTVPDNYFNSNVEGIINHIRNADTTVLTPAEELQSIAPALQFPHAQSFTLPIGYFDSVAENVLMKIKPQQSSVIRMNKRKIMWQYARAAVVTGFIAVSGLMVYNNQHPYDIGDTVKYDNEQQVNDGISHLSNDEIIKYLDVVSSPSDNENISNNIDEKQLPNVEELNNLSQTTKGRND